mgnify:CR=1 FL=1
MIMAYIQLSEEISEQIRKQQAMTSLSEFACRDAEVLRRKPESALVWYEDFCDYADAIAKGEAQEVREEVPGIVQ